MRAVRPRGGLRRQGEIFFDTFAPSLRDPRFWIPIRLASAAVLVAVACLGAFAPGSRELFRLQPAVPLALLAASVSLVFAIGTGLWLGRVGPAAFGPAVLVYAGLETMTSTSFAVYAEPPGAFVLLALPLLRGALDGLVFSSPVGFAAFTAAHGIGVLGAWALRPGAAHAPLVLLSAPLVMAAFAYCGRASVRIASSGARLSAQRAALQARHVLDRSAELVQASGALGELHRRRHAARSALSAALLAADRLAPLVRGDPELGRRGEALRSALGVLERVVAEGPGAGGTGAVPPGPPLDRVEVESLVRRVAGGGASRGVCVVLAAPGGGEPPAALVRGGEATLEQVVEQLVVNAVEGDGRRGARRVEVAVEVDERAGVVAVRIADDGPGFGGGLLERPVAPFVTTKARGVGLGLYTAERLVHASGGSLRLENLPEGGAAATVYLALAPRASTAERPALAGGLG